jgi:hypothetical protein
MRSKGVGHCVACGEDRWRFSEAAYVKGLLEQGESSFSLRWGEQSHLWIYTSTTMTDIRKVGNIPTDGYLPMGGAGFRC